MVKDTGETLHAGANKPVNAPEPLRVEADAAGMPVSVRLPRRQRVAAIEAGWRLDDEWWREAPLARLYYAACLASGQRLVFYKDIIGGGWYRQSY